VDLAEPEQQDSDSDAGSEGEFEPESYAEELVVTGKAKEMALLPEGHKW
jgi:hypothetical protein